MTKYISIITVLLLWIHQPAAAQEQRTSFTSQPTLPKSTISATPSRLISVTAGITRNRVILDWTVAENETANLFEIEKCTDGKNFNLVALVFGTDTPQTGNYQFYEKADKQKTLYRIKLVDKNNKTEYSRVIEINPEH